MTRWTDRITPIKVGDRVAYSAAWLRSTGQFAGDICHAKGIVTALESVGPDITLAVIDWGNPDIPAKVNVRNLALVGGRGYSA